MNRATRTTIVYALISGVVVWPAAVFLALPLGWAIAFKLMLWLCLSGYSVLLVCWSRKPKAAPIFPLMLLLGAALWPGILGAYLFMALGALSWIRSGICFDQNPLRALVAETITVFGGAGLVAALNPGTAITWSLSIWLFVLIQSLYFFIIFSPSQLREKITCEDPFNSACRNVRRILDS